MLSASSVADGGWGAVGVGGAARSAVGGSAARSAVGAAARGVVGLVGGARLGLPACLPACQHQGRGGAAMRGVVRYAPNIFLCAPLHFLLLSIAIGCVIVYSGVIAWQWCGAVSIK